jgi:hypothetical protein
VEHDNENPTADGLLVVWNLGEFHHYELFFELAQGYIHAASIIFEDQLSVNRPCYFNLLPGMFSLNHGIECFLKGAILLGDASVTVEDLTSGSLGHNLGNLYRRYRQVYPSGKLPNRVEELIRWTDTVVQGQGGVFERYLFDKVGRPLKQTGEDAILLDDTLDLIGELTREIQRLEQELKSSKHVSTRTRLQQDYSRIAR